MAECSPVTRDKPQANAPLSEINPKVPTATVASQRGAVCRNSRLKRAPRLTAITSCAAFDSQVGIADSC